MSPQFSTDAYVVRFDYRRPLVVIGVGGLFIVVLLWGRPAGVISNIVLAVLAVTFIVAGFVDAIRVYRGVVAFALDERGVYRCVGVRTPVAQLIDRHEGVDPLATSFPKNVTDYLIRAGRGDLLPGADGTYVLAYRRMQGWRIQPSQLRVAVTRFAPGLRVVEGRKWPAELSWSEALRSAKR